MKLTIDDIHEIIKANRAELKHLSFGSFYIKDEYPKENNAIKELIAARLIKDFNIFSPKIYIVDIDDVLYILSEDISTKGNFKTAFDLGINYFQAQSLYGIWDFLEKEKFNYPILMFEIIKIYIFDVLFMIHDRHSCNWGILTISGQSQIAILDNECIFDEQYPRFRTSYIDHDDYNCPDEKLKDENKQEYLKLLKEVNLKDFLNFLKESSREFLELFDYYYNLMTVEHFKEILNEIERENVIITENGNKPLIISNKEEMIETYKENYQLIGELWKGIKHGRK